MAGGKGKSSGGKSSGGKTSATEGPKKQQSHSARAGLQVRLAMPSGSALRRHRRRRLSSIPPHAIRLVRPLPILHAMPMPHDSIHPARRVAGAPSSLSSIVCALPTKTMQNMIEAIKYFIDTRATCAGCTLHTSMIRLFLARSDFSGTSPLHLASHLGSTWLCAGSRGRHRTRLSA